MSALGYAADSEDHDEIQALRKRVAELEATIKESLTVRSEQQDEPVAYLHQCRKKKELRVLRFEKIVPELKAKGFEAIPLVHPQPAQLPTIQPGWKLVPVEPTSEMLEVGLRKAAREKWLDGASPLRARTDNLRPNQEIAALQWSAMLAAAPQPPQAAPAQWVGLTDKEVAEIERNSLHRGQAIRAIESALREKNGGIK